MASYALLPFVNNVNGWGPSTYPAKFIGLPYSDYNKAGRIGALADFSAQTRQYRERADKRHGRVKPKDAESDMVLVDSTKQKKQSRLGRPRGGQQNQGWRQHRNREERVKKRNEQANDRTNRRYKKLANARYTSRRRVGWNAEQTRFDASVNITSNWKVVEQLEMSEFDKLKVKAYPEAEDVAWCGHVEKYEEKFDRVTSKKPVKLQKYDDRAAYLVTTLEDPVIEELAESLDDVQVWGTDTLISQIMCASRSKVGWDIVVTRAGNMVFFDKRRESTLDMFSVDETSYDPPSNDDPESINSSVKLSLEATAINQNFAQQVVSGDKGTKKFDRPNPFFDNEEEEGKVPQPVCYRYRKFKLGDTAVLCRTELHGFVSKKDGDKFMTTFAVNEYDPKLAKNTPWKSKIDTQPGGIIATELRNNALKIGKWAAQTILAGADLMKIGFVSRASVKNPFVHNILATKFYKPAQFARQINLSVQNMWAVLKMIVDLCLRQPEGKYCLVKDPNKQQLYLYSVPHDEFDSDDDGVTDDSDEDDDSSDDDDDDDDESDDE